MIERSGGVAQLVRAVGSYPARQWFESTRRYHLTTLFLRSGEVGPALNFYKYDRES